MNLSPKEEQVVNCLLRGLSLRDTATELGIKEGTVKFHRTALYKRFNVTGDVGLVLYLWGAGYARPGTVQRATEALPGGLA